jgi:YcaO-like protein with predicted kinase domain
MSTAIMYRTGTYRSASPESTRDRIRPMLDRFSITRVADITDLDEIGLPTMVCYRPDSKTITVSIGTGIEPAQAFVSAVMEAIEIWHLEYAELPVAETGPANAVGIGYDVRALSLAPNSPVTSRTPLDWVAGRGLLTGTPKLAPAAVLRLGLTSSRTWHHAYFNVSSNGTATGNTLAEATLHAMFEVIERGCVAEYIASDKQNCQHVNPESASNPATARVVAAVASAGCRFETLRLDNSYGLPCYAATIWSADVPIQCSGFGCHIDPEIAFGRAVAEAAQSRLATISGARDDIDNYLYRPSRDFSYDSRSATIAIADGIPAAHFDGIEDVLAYCARGVRDVTGFEPFTIDLTQPGIDIPVSSVIAPAVPVCDFGMYHANRFPPQSPG